MTDEELAKWFLSAGICIRDFEDVKCDGVSCKECRMNWLQLQQTMKIPNIIDRLAAYEDILGGEYDLDRLRELAQADREGRCVVLPATPDQIIYRWRKGDDCPSVSRLDGVQINADGEITYPIWNGYLTPGDFGETVFLTREEAALRREQDGE